MNNDDEEHFMEIEDETVYQARCIAVPETYEKIKKTASGGKISEVKRVKRDVPFGEMYEAGKIKVKNANDTRKTAELV